MFLVYWSKGNRHGVKLYKTIGHAIHKYTALINKGIPNVELYYNTELIMQNNFT